MCTSGQHHSQSTSQLVGWIGPSTAADLIDTVRSSSQTLHFDAQITFSFITDMIVTHCNNHSALLGCLESEICRMETSNMWVRLRLRNFFCSEDWKKQRQRRIMPLDFQTRKLVVSRMLLDAIIPALPTERCWARKNSPWRTEISAESSEGGNRLQNWIQSTKPRVITHTGKVTELLL